MTVNPLHPPMPASQNQAAQATANKPPPEGLEIGMEMLKRLEPDLTPLPMDVMICSIAVSLRGIHNDLSSIRNALEQGNYGQRDSLKAISDMINTLGGQMGNVRSGIDRIASAKRDAIQNELSKMPY